MVMGAFAAMGAGGDDDEEPRPGLLAATPFATAEDRQLTELWLRRRLGGGALATLLTRGVPTLAGVDLSAALGAGTATAVFPYVQRGKTALETAQKQVWAALGATTGTVARVARGIDFMASGDLYKGLEQWMPSGVGNAMQGLREGVSGKTDKSGTLLTPANDIAEWDSALKMVGLKSATETERSLLQQKVILSEQHYDEIRKDIGADYVRAKREGDTAELSKLRSRWLRVAASMRGQGLKAPTLTELNNYWVRDQRDQRQVIRGVVVPKGARRLALEGV
jgi:hypothetical protein